MDHMAIAALVLFIAMPAIVLGLYLRELRRARKLPPASSSLTAADAEASRSALDASGFNG